MKKAGAPEHSNVFRKFLHRQESSIIIALVIYIIFGNHSAIKNQDTNQKTA